MPIPGPMELVLLLVIVLIIFGPGKLPDIGNAVGKGIREFRKASNELEESVRGEPKQTSTDDRRPAKPSSAEVARISRPAARGRRKRIPWRG
ncbi:MAG: twin-arginine translocase TatA/TatE family subunit [Chloroflexi bacterium]|nr:twin-arginine translocase TatA/TatE family subunit [Chloroflexota bacterium]